jgi:hypothetical protein
MTLVLASLMPTVVEGLILNEPPHNQADGRGLRIQPSKPLEALPTGSKRFALVIGVDEYEDSQINKLEGAGNDAKAIVEALVQYADFPRDQVRLLTSDQPAERKPTRNKILRQLSNLRGAVPKDGLLLIAFAGHGIERGGQAYLLPSDAELSDDVSLLEQSSINVDEMRKRIVEAGVGQVVMILDACRNDPAAGHGDSDKGMFTEQAMWETIRGSADPADFKSYLKQFPGGKNASLASRLGEDAAWERIRDSKNVSDYQAYLREYPKGRFAEIAIRRAQPPATPIKTATVPQRPSKGILTVLTNTPATVTVTPRDASSAKPLTGQSGGQDNKFRAELPPGLYDLEVSAAKYSSKRVSGIKLETDEAIPVELIPLGGTIQIGGVETAAIVFVDDQKASNAIARREEKLIEVADVTAGRHRLSVSQPNQIEWTREVEVEDGRTKYVPAEFKPALVGLVVSTEPDAEIYIDDNYSGRANEKGQIRIIPTK